MTGLDLAYAAGIIDARGHIEVLPTRVRLRVTTRRVTLLDWLAARTGTTVRIDERGYQRRGCSAHCTDRHQHIERQSAYWNVDGLRARIVLDAVLPWLVDQMPNALQALRALERPGPVDVARTEIGALMLRLGWPLPALERVS